MWEYMEIQSFILVEALSNVQGTKLRGVCDAHEFFFFLSVITNIDQFSKSN